MTKTERALLLALAEYNGAHSGDPPRKKRIEELGKAVAAEAEAAEGQAPASGEPPAAASSGAPA